MKVIVCRVGGAPEYVDFPSNYNRISDFVGGYVEVAYIESGVCLVCNEEGTISGLPFNRYVPAFAPPIPSGFEDAIHIQADPDLLPPGSGQQGYYHVYGNFLICGSSEEGWTDLPEEFVYKFMEALKL